MKKSILLHKYSKSIKLNGRKKNLQIRKLKKHLRHLPCSGDIEPRRRKDLLRNNKFHQLITQKISEKNKGMKAV